MNLFRVICLFAVLGFASQTLLAQNPTLLKKQGEKDYAAGHWQAAVESLNQYQQLKPGDSGVLTKLGICYYRLHQPEQAKRLLEFVRNQNPYSKDADLHFYYARTLHGLQEYEKAIPAYKSFLRAAPAENPLRGLAADNILRCASGMAIETNENVALVENLGNRVNSLGDEFGPIPSVNHPDRLYYSAAREGCTGGRRNPKGLEDTEKGEWCSDMFIANQRPTGWETAGNLGGLLNTSRYETALDFNANGQVLYFSRGFSLFSGDILVDTAGRKDEYAVESPVFAGPLQAEEGDGSPFFFNDTTLLFASRRPGGFGGLDLYWSVFSKNVWSNPQNLGAAINSAYDETTPFLALDGRTLYFSANSPNSIGGFDVYKAVYDPAIANWQAPQNMGLPISSPGDDAFFRLAADGNTGYFASDRLDSYGERDLYVAYFKAPQEEQLGEKKLAWFKAMAQAAKAKVPTADELKKVALPALFYNTDRDLLSPENLSNLDEVARLARTYPDASVHVTVHTDETGAAKFDLYNGIKRAEIVGKALMERGVPSARMLLKSVGPYYPIARNATDAGPSPEGQRLNRRVEISLNNLAGDLPLQTLVERPQVSAGMALNGAARFDQWAAGLSYKVEVAVTRQLFNNDALSMFGDGMIESQPGAGAYRYTAGYFQQFNEAARLRKNLQAQGFNEAVVIAYLNGIRLPKAEAVGLLKKWPDLAFFIRG